MKIAYYSSNRTVFPPPANIVAANADVMANIVRGMIGKGHDITVYASKGSSMPGAKIIDLNLVPHELDYAYQREEWVKDLHIGYRLTYISQMIADSANYDLIHLHVGRAIFGEPFIRFSQCPIVFTLHESLVSHLAPIMGEFKDANLISISYAQRQAIPNLNYIANIYHGIDVGNFQFGPTGSDNYVFMSRVSPEKGVEDAIEACLKAGVKLLIFGPGDKEYLEKNVLPKTGEGIQYKGMVEYRSSGWVKAYAQSKAFILPIQWEEPFGLVFVEAMAFGTPVIAYARGSVPEIIKDGKTGFVVNYSENDKRGNWVVKKTGVQGLIEAIGLLEQMPEKEYQSMRRACREHVEKNFTVEKMVDGYEKVYENLYRNIINNHKYRK
jgi:glycosyltransferase involved in cell wall biosynthesis